MTPPRTATELDEITLKRAIRGEAAACRALVEAYQTRVFALASRMVGQRGRATVEDVAQETFLGVFRRLPAFDVAGPARLSTWILSICARRAIDELRKQRPETGIAIEKVGGSRDAVTARAIEAAVGELGPEHRAAFLLREYHGLDYDEICTALGLELGTVKSRLSRARAALRERLAP
jgi:RNA polymerase sigma-70 factor (ECF subfamily)